MKATTIAVALTSAILPSCVLACQTVSSWENLKERIESTEMIGGHGEPLVFCPFKVSKPADDNIEIEDKMIAIYCAEPRTCIVSGPGNHIHIKGQDTEFLVDGFVFRGATESSVVIDDTERFQTFVSCNFGSNANVDGEGGAISISEGTSALVSVEKCVFYENEAMEGGAISHRGDGELVVQHSWFGMNRAVSGIIHLSGSDETSARISETTFSKNALESDGPDSGVISAQNDGDVLLGGDNASWGYRGNEGGCNGIYVRAHGRCDEFGN